MRFFLELPVDPNLAPKSFTKLAGNDHYYSPGGWLAVGSNDFEPNFPYPSGYGRSVPWRVLG